MCVLTKSLQNFSAHRKKRNVSVLHSILHTFLHNSSSWTLLKEKREKKTFFVTKFHSFVSSFMDELSARIKSACNQQWQSKLIGKWWIIHLRQYVPVFEFDVPVWKFYATSNFSDWRQPTSQYLLIPFAKWMDWVWNSWKSENMSNYAKRQTVGEMRSLWMVPISWRLILIA